MNNLPLISVIIPIYNVKDYLDRCVQSVLAQTYTNLQIILVDDGSTDGSGEVCDLYKEKDSRVEVIHKPNGGVSSARNAGLKAVKGDFIGFVDSDDYIAPEMYEKMYGAIERTGADYAECSYTLAYSDGTLKEIRDKDIDFSKPYYTKDEYFKLRSEHILKSRFSFACNKLSKTKLFDGLYFDSNYQIGEDFKISFEYQYKAEKLALIDDCLYFYFQNNSSCVYTYTHKKVLDTAKSYIDGADFMYSHGYKKGGDNAAFIGAGLFITVSEAYPLTDKENLRRFDEAFVLFRNFFKKHFSKLVFGKNYWMLWLYLYPYLLARAITAFDKKFIGGKLAAQITYQPDAEKFL